MDGNKVIQSFRGVGTNLLIYERQMLLLGTGGVEVYKALGMS
jgi:hypothetical protein